MPGSLRVEYTQAYIADTEATIQRGREGRVLKRMFLKNEDIKLGKAVWYFGKEYRIACIYENDKVDMQNNEGTRITTKESLLQYGYLK
jgi:hypothetical protein